jgi:integrase
VARTYGTGSFKKRSWTRKDGSKVTAYRGYVYDSAGNQVWATGKTKREAEANALAKAKNSGPVRDATAGQEASALAATISLSAFSAQYIERKTDARYGSVRKYENLRSHLIGYRAAGWTRALGEFEIDKVTYDHLESFMSHFRATYAANYSHLMQTFVRSLFQNAVDHELISVNRAKRLPAIKRRRKKELGIDDDGFVRLLSGTTDERMHAWLALAYHGCRISEILGLTADRIVGNTVLIDRQLGRVKNPNGDSPQTVVALTPLKTEESRRTLTLSDEVLRILMRSLDYAKPTKVYDEELGEDVPVLMVIPNERGRVWQAHNFRLQFNALCHKVGVKTNPHEFRAMMITDTISGDAALGIPAMDVKIVSQSVGHSGFQVTQDAYNRVRRSSVESATLARSERLKKVALLK